MFVKNGILRFLLLLWFHKCWENTRDFWVRERGRYCSRQIELHVHTSFPCPQGPIGMTSGSRENAFLRVTLVLGQEFRTWENPILHRGCWKMCTTFSGERCYFYYPGQGKKKSPLCSRGRYTVSFVLYRHFWKASPREKKKKKLSHNI